MGVTLGDIVVAPNGTTANTSADTYHPVYRQLTIPTVQVGSKTYYNAVVRCSS